MDILMKLLDRTTMYRVIFYVLITWIIIALGLSAAGFFFFGPLELLASLAVLILSCAGVHVICQYATNAPANIESSFITALILVLIFDPTLEIDGLMGLAAVGALAIVSKYIFVYRNVHIFNPVAFAAVAASLLGISFATWWIGNYAMFLVVAVGGFIIAYKIRRIPLVGITILAGTVVYLIATALFADIALRDFSWYFLSWPIIFFATIMVTEPLSTPAGTKNQLLYGATVGALSSLPFTLGPLYSTPELALLIGNFIFFFTTLRARLVLTLQSVQEIAHNTYELAFTSKHPFSFRPGQYLEWSLPHKKSDVRGIRRYFTIASSPTEENVLLGMKMPEKGSSFKRELRSLKDKHIYAASLDGDFLLPKKSKRKLVFISGGIGVTPFRSMTKFLIDTKDRRDIVHFYCNNEEQDIAYQDIWDEAQEVGVKTVHVVSKPTDNWAGERGYFSVEILKKHCPDFKDRQYYISGPPGMVSACSKSLRSAGVSRRHIHVDYFPGLA